MKKKFTSYGRNLLILAIVLLTSQTGLAQFTPGEGGSLPTFTAFTEAPNKVSGFFVKSSQRANNSFSSGTRSVVDLSFPEPSTIGADTYTLQFSTDNGSHWNNYQYNGIDLTSNYNNFSLNFDAEYKLRLLVNGGPKNGYTSNEVYAPLSSVDTRFASWSLDESMFLTGVMMPWVGRGLEASFTVRKLEDESEITGHLTYQWYRVNPATFEMIEIPGATTLSYTTTETDAGYNLAIKASGDGVIDGVGGFIQIFSMDKTVIPNKAFASNITNNGFTLNLFKSLSNLTVDDLTLTDKDNNPITITSVSPGINTAIYNIGATLDVNLSPYQLQSKSDFWRLVSEIEGGFMMMQGLRLEFIATGINALNENSLSIYPIPTSDIINFKFNGTVSQAEIVGLNGQSIIKTSINSKVGKINTVDLNSGIYLLRLVTSNGVIMRKFEVIK